MVMYRRKIAVIVSLSKLLRIRLYELLQSNLTRDEKEVKWLRDQCLYADSRRQFQK